MFSWLGPTKRPGGGHPHILKARLVSASTKVHIIWQSEFMESRGYVFMRHGDHCLVYLVIYWIEYLRADTNSERDNIWAGWMCRIFIIHIYTLHSGGFGEIYYPKWWKYPKGAARGEYHHWPKKYLDSKKKINLQSKHANSRLFRELERGCFAGSPRMIFHPIFPGQIHFKSPHTRVIRL